MSLADSVMQVVKEMEESLRKAIERAEQEGALLTDTELIYPEQIDHKLNWRLGTTARLARRKKLPHYVLPDGAIRLRWDEVEALVRRVPALVLRVPPPDQGGYVQD